MILLPTVSFVVFLTKDYIKICFFANLLARFL